MRLRGRVQLSGGGEVVLGEGVSVDPELGPGGDDYPASSATTGVVSVGGSTTGNIESTSDQDWFRVSIPAQAVYYTRTTVRAEAERSQPLREMSTDRNYPRD